MTPIAYSQTAGMSSARSVRLLSSDAVRRCSRPGWAKRLQSWQGVPRAAATDSQVQVERAVKFSIQQRVEFGESMRLVGGSDQFGAWNPDGAPLLQWGEDHVWTWDGTLPLGEYEFKVVITRQEGEPSWEDGDNRKLVVVAGDAAIDVNMSWGNVAEMVVTETEVEGGLDTIPLGAVLPGAVLPDPKGPEPTHVGTVPPDDTPPIHTSAAPDTTSPDALPSHTDVEAIQSGTVLPAEERLQHVVTPEAVIEAMAAAESEQLAHESAALPTPTAAAASDSTTASAVPAHKNGVEASDAAAPAAPAGWSAAAMNGIIDTTNGTVHVAADSEAVGSNEVAPGELVPETTSADVVDVLKGVDVAAPMDAAAAQVTNTVQGAEVIAIPEQAAAEVAEVSEGPNSSVSKEAVTPMRAAAAEGVDGLQGAVAGTDPAAALEHVLEVADVLEDPTPEQKAPPMDNLPAADNSAPTDNLAATDKLSPRDKLQPTDTSPPMHTVPATDKLPPMDALAGKVSDTLPGPQAITAVDPAAPEDVWEVGDVSVAPEAPTLAEAYAAAMGVKLEVVPSAPGMEATPHQPPLEEAEAVAGHVSPALQKQHTQRQARLLEAGDVSAAEAPVATLAEAYAAAMGVQLEAVPSAAGLEAIPHQPPLEEAEAAAGHVSAERSASEVGIEVAAERSEAVIADGYVVLAAAELGLSAGQSAAGMAGALAAGERAAGVAEAAASEHATAATYEQVVAEVLHGTIDVHPTPSTGVAEFASETATAAPPEQIVVDSLFMAAGVTSTLPTGSAGVVALDPEAAEPYEQVVFASLAEATEAHLSIFKGVAEAAASEATTAAPHEQGGADQQVGTDDNDLVVAIAAGDNDMLSLSTGVQAVPAAEATTSEPHEQLAAEDLVGQSVAELSLSTGVAGAAASEHDIPQAVETHAVDALTAAAGAAGTTATPEKPYVEEVVVPVVDPSSPVVVPEVTQFVAQAIAQIRATHEQPAMQQTPISGSYGGLVAAAVPAVEKEVAGENGSSKDGVNGSSAASTEAGAGSTGGSIVPDTIPAALVESVLERELSNTLNGSVETTGTADRASSGAGDAFVRAASALDLESDTSSPPNGSRSVLLATAMASSTKQAAVGSTAATKNSADGYGWEGADPSAAALDALMSAVAFAAVPVVGWSLYTLHSTGCGLPPGPDGLLGAAEGVSYLGVTAMAGYGLYKRATGGASAGVVVAAELLSYSTIAIGLAVLAVQVQSYGYIPSALPDVNCFGDGSPTSTLPPLSLPDIKLPAVDLKPLQDSFKQVGSTLDAVKSQLPSVAAQLSKQLSSQAAALTSKLPSQEFLASQVNQGVAQAQTLGAQLGAQVGSGLSKAQEVGAQLSTQAGTASSQLIVKLDSSFQAVPGQLQQLSAGLNQLSSKLPPLPPQ